ncbi:translation initiation factor IF-3, mitochondrial [Salminus brasiliensis]|uniref:translation initiation factor IF-3, mitochondrial n=1 Tax=Salminus brasiliensis TaxID=930266 RepID=UPI003B82EA0D
MTLGCLRLVLSLAAKAVHHPVRSPSPVTLLQPQSQPYRPLNSYLSIALQQWTQFCTAVGDSETAAGKPETKKKHNPKAPFRSVGRKIHPPNIQLLDEDGGNLGVVQRLEALRLMDKSGLRLVLISEYSEPPVYQLMSGKQIHEMKMELREKQKAKAAGIVQVKELTLSFDIASHDLDTKLKQAENWLEKKHHIRLTLKARKRRSSSISSSDGGGDDHDNDEEDLGKILKQMVEKMPIPVEFVTKIQLVREGQAAICVLRPLSAKELQKARKRAQNPTNTSQREPGEQNAALTSTPDPLKDSEQQ